MPGAVVRFEIDVRYPSTSRLLMIVRSSLRGTFLLLILTCAAVLSAQSGSKLAVGENPLQQHYSNAQDLQRKGKLNEAAEQYRAFLADALGELAMGYGMARDYPNASPLFDEALALEPGSPTLLLDYARTALVLGDLARAQTLATEFIGKFPGNREQLALGHQVLGRTLLKLNRNQEARKEFEAAVALDPTFPNGYDLAVACLDLGDENCAVQIFNEMQKSFGDTPEIHMAFGRAFANSDFQPRALTEFRRAIEENPRLPGAHYLLAAVLLATGGDESHLDDAEAELKKELAISPRHSLTYTALGKIATTRKNYAEAETFLKKAILLGPNNPDAYLYIGQIYFETNRSAQAETSLRQCIRLTTDVSRNRYQVQKAHFLLGRILMQQGQQNAAHSEMVVSRELANRTLSQDKNSLAGLMDTSQDVQSLPAAGTVATPPGPPTVDPLAEHRTKALREQLRFPVADSYNNLGAITATNNSYSDAVTYFERASVWNPSLDGLDYNWGRAAFAGSQFTEAIVPLSRYLRAHPDDTGARSVLAISQFMIGNYRDCIEALEPVIGKGDLAPQAEYVYAESLVRTGRIASGVERLVALQKLHPEIPDVHRALGEAFSQQGEKQRALEELRTAIQLNPRAPDSHYELGKIELENGDTAAAIPELEAATRLLPTNQKFHQELANAYMVAGRPEDARKEIETYNRLRSRTK